jgi:nucleotide-binding universal stress UspA family protein
MAGEQPREIGQILVGTGLTPESVGAVHVSKLLASRLGAELHAIHVIEPMSSAQKTAMPELAEKQLELGREELRLFAESHSLTGAAAELHCERGSAGEAMMTLGNEIGADLLVIGRYGKGGLKRGAIGSIANELVRSFPVSVLVVQPEFREDGFKRIGVASDFTDESLIAVRRAIQLTRTFGDAELVVLHAYQVPVGYHTISSYEEASESLEKVAGRLGEEMIEKVRAECGDIKVRFVMSEGAPEQRVPEMADQEGLDLLVVSTHSRSRSALILLGRTTEKIIKAVNCSVWAERGPSLKQGMLEALKALLN